MKSLQMAAIAACAAVLPTNASAQITITAISEIKTKFPTLQVNNNFPQSCIPAIQRALGNISNAAHSDGRRSTFRASMLSSYWTAYGWDSGTGRSTVPNNYQYSVVLAKPGSAMSRPGRIAETSIAIVRNPDGTPKPFFDGYHFNGYQDMEFNADIFYYNTGQAGGGFHCPATRSTAPSNLWNMENIAGHETAHWSGMLHNARTGSLMADTITQTDPAYKALVAPGDDEIVMLIRLYGLR
jgi:hypothetical protein